MKKNEFESVNCNLCGSNQYKELYQKNGFHIVRCSGCGLVYVNPRLRMGVLHEMYNKNKISPFQYYVKNIDEDRATFKNRLKLIEKYIKPGKLLEVGCSVGTFLNVARDNGWKVYGIDVNKLSAKYCRDKLNLFVKATPFEKSKLQKNSFDLIIMNDLIEHVPEPLQTLKKAHELLKKEGILFIATPDIGATIPKLSGKKWLHLKPDEHIYYFNRETINTALSKAGFKVIGIKPLGRVRNLSTIFFKAGTYSDLPFRLIRTLKMEQALGKISFNLNLFDEIGVIARK